MFLLARGIVAADEEGFRPIFDGKSLEGWDGDPRLWRVEDGAITGETTTENLAERNTFLIWRGGKPADFELKAEFRMPNPGFANSGIQIRSWEGPQEVARQRLPARHGRGGPVHRLLLRRKLPRQPRPARPEGRRSARTTSRRSSSSSATRRNLPRSSRSTTGTSTTSSPRETTSSRRSTGS